MATSRLALRLVAVVVRHARLLGADISRVMMLACALRYIVRVHHQCGRAVSGALDRIGSDRGRVATDDGNAVVECAEQTGIRTRTACSYRRPAATREPRRCPSRGLWIHASAAVCAQGAGHDAHSDGRGLTICGKSLPKHAVASVVPVGEVNLKLCDAFRRSCGTRAGIGSCPLDTGAVGCSS